MYYRISFLFAILVGMSTFAHAAEEVINIRGKVTSDDKPLAGATVTLSGRDLKDTTDDKGEYLIQKNVVAVQSFMVSHTRSIALRNGILELYLPNASPVKIEIFDVKGYLIGKEETPGATAGTYRMDIAGICRTTKLLVIQASIGENAMTFRYLPFSDGIHALNRFAEKSSPVAGGRLAKVAAAVDSLTFAKEGFTTKVVAIGSLDTTVDISLDSAATPPEFVEDAGYDCQVASPSGSNGGSNSVLPDPFTMWDGTQVKTMEQWRCRRRELLVEAEKRMLGEKAPPPAKIGGTVSGSISETEYTVKVDNPKGSISFGGNIHLPKTGSAPYPAIIVINIKGFGTHSLVPEVLESEGVAWMEFFDPYGMSSEASGDYSTGKYFTANPDYKGKTGALVAWGWGVSRIIDMLELHPEVIDPTKIGVHGCSRFGKAAFVIGAFDQRIALGLPLESGTGGPPPLRALSSLGGQTLASCNGESSWFGPTSKSYSANMPVDMSDVVALYAPRGLLMMDNAHIGNLSYKTNYLGCAAGREVFKAMGREDALWYLGNSGNGTHCATRTEYGDAERAMIRKFLKGDNSATTGGLDKHANHGTINVDSWTGTWKKGTISE